MLLVICLDGSHPDIDLSFSIIIHVKMILFLGALEFLLSIIGMGSYAFECLLQFSLLSGVGPQP